MRSTIDNDKDISDNLLKEDEGLNSGRKKLTMRWVWILTITMIILGIGCLVVGVIKIKQTEKKEGDKQYLVEVVVTSKSEIKRNQSGYYIDNFKSTDIKNLTIKYASRIEVLHTDFPEIKQLKYQSQNIKNIELDPLLNVSTLITNNTILSTLTVNNSYLKNLVIYNNNISISFVNLNLASLTNLIIQHTQVQKWQNNSFDQLANFSLRNTQNLTFPDVKHIIQNVQLINVFDLYLFQIDQYIKVKNLVVNHYYASSVTVINNHYIQTFNFLDKNLIYLHFINTTIKTISVSSIRYYLRIIDAQQLNTLNINFTNIFQFHIQNTSLTELSVVDQPIILETFIVRNTPLVEIPLNIFNIGTMGSLFQIDYSRIKKHNFISLAHSIKYVQILNYKGELLLPKSETFDIFGTLNLTSCALTEYNWNQLKIKRLFLTDVEMQINSFTEIINEETIQQVHIKGDVNINDVNNVNFKADFQFELEIVDCPHLKEITNSQFTKLRTITIINCSQLQRIQKNVLGEIVKINIQKNPKLTWNQTYTSISNVQAHIGDPSKQELQTIIQLNYNITNLYISGYNNVNFTAEFISILTNLKQMSITSSSNCYFSSNTLNITTLQLQGFIDIAGNTLLKLQQLIILNNPQLNIQLLITELQQLKVKGTMLKTIVLPLTATEDDKNSIKAIFPDIVIK